MNVNNDRNKRTEGLAMFIFSLWFKFNRKSNINIILSGLRRKGREKDEYK